MVFMALVARLAVQADKITMAMSAIEQACFMGLK
jgi:hypothetical protein